MRASILGLAVVATLSCLPAVAGTQGLSDVNQAKLNAIGGPNSPRAKEMLEDAQAKLSKGQNHEAFLAVHPLHLIDHGEAKFIAGSALQHLSENNVVSVSAGGRKAGVRLVLESARLGYGRAASRVFYETVNPSMLGRFDYGIGKAEALALLEQAAAKGDANALETMGGLYASGRHVPASAKKAMDFYTRAEKADGRPSMGKANLLRRKSLTEKGQAVCYGYGKFPSFWSAPNGATFAVYIQAVATGERGPAYNAAGFRVTSVRGVMQDGGPDREQVEMYGQRFVPGQVTWVEHGLDDWKPCDP